MLNAHKLLSTIPHSCAMHVQGPLPLDKESFMNGKLGLGLAIPEDATAKLGPLPMLPTGPRQNFHEFEVGSRCQIRVVPLFSQLDEADSLGRRSQSPSGVSLI